MGERIAVVGGGIAGLYAAWILKEQGHDIKIFEATDRLGGRILSQKVGGVAGPAELGAMRFRETHHQLTALIDVLGVASSGDVRRFDFTDRFYLRGSFFAEHTNVRRLTHDARRSLAGTPEVLAEVQKCCDELATLNPKKKSESEESEETKLSKTVDALRTLVSKCADEVATKHLNWLLDKVEKDPHSGYLADWSCTHLAQEASRMISSCTAGEASRGMAQLLASLATVGPESPAYDGLVGELRAVVAQCTFSTTDKAQIEQYKAQIEQYVERLATLPHQVPRYQVYQSEDQRLPGQLLKLAADHLFLAAKDKNLKDGFGALLDDPAIDVDKFVRLFENFTTHEIQGGEAPAENTRPQPLHNIGFWDVLALHLSSEAFQLAHDGIGYEVIANNWNAHEALWWFAADFAVVDFKTLAHGLSSLVDGLKKKLNIGQADGVQVKCRRKLERVETGVWPILPDRSSMVLHFDDGSDSRCDKVVLALPRSALEQIDIVGSANWRHVRSRVIPAVRGQRAFKCFLVYKEPWWTDLPDDTPFSADDRHAAQSGSTSFRVCTDLAVRQVYYFTDTWLRKRYGASTDAQNQYSLVMASYAEGHFAEFWQPLMVAAESGDDQDLYRSDAAKQADVEEVRPYLASRRMVNYITAHLLKIHHCFGDGGRTASGYEDLAEKIRSPVMAVYKDWNPEKGEAAWHYWEVGFRRQAVESLIDRLALEDGLLICGEAYSDQQGWIEGALRSTQRVLLKSTLVTTENLMRLRLVAPAAE
jgi:monoamine oxidase